MAKIFVSYSRKDIEFAKRLTGELYRGTRLKKIEEWAKNNSALISPLGGGFLKASQNVKKRERRNWIALAGVGIVLLLLVVLGVTGKLNRFIYLPLEAADNWVTIPAGEFQMGSENGDDNEKPVHTVDVDEFQIGKYEVTNLQYAQCVKADVCVRSVFGEDKALHPVVNVTWYDAKHYCEWAGGRLPTEAEWEKAASWDDETKTKFVYPWGNSDPTPTLLNYNSEVGDTTPVGTYPDGISPYGLFDMAGNVWELTSSLYQPYPYNAADGRENLSSSDYRVLRSGSWYSNDDVVRSASRYLIVPSDYYAEFGFRCARSLP